MYFLFSFTPYYDSPILFLLWPYLRLRRAHPKYALCARGNPWRCTELLEAADWYDEHSTEEPRVPFRSQASRQPTLPDAAQRPRRQLVSYDPTAGDCLCELWGRWGAQWETAQQVLRQVRAGGHRGGGTSKRPSFPRIPTNFAFESRKVAYILSMDPELRLKRVV